MESVVDQPLGDVHHLDARLFERAAIQDHLVRHRAVFGLIQHVVRTFKSRFQVVGVQNGHLGALRQPALAKHLDVGVRDLGNQCTSKWRSTHRVDGRVLAHRHHVVARQERHQMRRDPNRAHTRAASPVRDGEGLVEVEVTHVCPDHARAGESHLGVHVGPVHVHLSAVGVNHFCHFEDRTLKHPVRGRVGDHQSPKVLAVLLGLGTQIVDVDVAMLVASNHHHFHARHDSTRRVGAMGAVGDQTNVPVAFPAGRVVRSNHHQPGKFSLGSAVWLERDSGETGDFGQVALELGEHGTCAFGLIRWAKGMQFCERRPRDGDQFGRRVQLHGARPERNHGVGQAQILVLQMLDVPHHLRLGAVAVEDRVVEVIHGTGQRTQERFLKDHALDRAHAKDRAQRRKVVAVDALVKGNSHVFAVGVVTQVDALRLGAGAQRLHGVLASCHMDLEGVEVARVHHSKRLVGPQRDGQGAGVRVDAF